MIAKRSQGGRKKKESQQRVLLPKMEGVVHNRGEEDGTPGVRRLLPPVVVTENLHRRPVINNCSSLYTY